MSKNFELNTLYCDFLLHCSAFRQFLLGLNYFDFPLTFMLTSSHAVVRFSATYEVNSAWRADCIKLLKSI